MRNGRGGSRAPVGITIVAVVAAVGLSASASGFAAVGQRAVARGHAQAKHKGHRRHAVVRRNVRGQPRGIVRALSPAARRRLAHIASTCVSNPCLRYHLGSVLHSHRVYIIYWQPSNGSDPDKQVSAFPIGPPTYQTVINAYMANVAAADGALDNVYSVATQYSDNVGFAGYGVSFPAQQPPLDTDALPASGCSDPAPTLQNHACLTDSQIQNEVDAFVQSQHLPQTGGEIYFLVTPPGLASCFTATASDGCYDETISGKGYCAFHGDFNLNGHGVTLYANMPYAGVPACRTGPQPANQPPDHPNNSPADDLVSIMSHEQIETMTDPQSATGPGAWFNDATGQEIGDICAEDYGTALGSNSGGAFNQLINNTPPGNGNYELQTEWSNQANACASALLSGPPPPPPITLAPVGGPYYQAQTVNFSATSRSGMTYVWDLGDGTRGASSDSTGSGSNTVSHPYANPGTYTITVRAVDPASNVTSAPASATVTVLPALPVASFTLSPGAPTSGQVITFDGRASTDPHGGGVALWQWSFGDGAFDVGSTQHHTYAAMGTFNVSLTVTNTLGQTATKTQTVTVGPDPPTLRRLCRDQLGNTLRSAVAGFKANAALNWLTPPAQPPGAKAGSKDAVLAYALSRVKGGEILATVSGAGADSTRELKALKACPSRSCGGVSRRLLSTALQGLLKAAAHRRGFRVVSMHRPLTTPCQAPAVGVGQELTVFVLTRGHRTEQIQIQLS